MNYVIYDMNNVANIDFSKVIEDSVDTLRLSVDESLTVLKYEGRKPSFLNGLQKYTHSEILAIMRTSEWSKEEE
jgi:hypothetical protein